MSLKSNEIRIFEAMAKKGKISRIKLRLSELHNENYKNYIQSSQWADLRKQYFQRAGYRCMLCNGSGGGLELHHRTYRNLGHEKPADLITLCNNCHNFFHSHKSLVQEIRAVNSNGS
jgi:5-methylcytosine-specific restriction endonuclease McrA